MTTTAEPKRQYKVIGTRPVRHDGVDKVTGRAKYGIDVQITGMLHGAILRCPHAHARIKRIDTAKALSHPEVKAVMTAADLPEKPTQGMNPLEVLSDINLLHINVMARDRALYKGMPVAAVAATTRFAAQEALDLVEVEYEVLPHVSTVREAMAPGAPVIHPDLRTAHQKQGEVTQGTEPTNVASHTIQLLGDPDGAFKNADVVVEVEMETSLVHQGYIEPHNATAQWSSDGNITIWKSTQAPFIVRAQVAAILNVPTSKVLVIPMEIGGGFGGRVMTDADAAAAVLSKMAGRPVKIMFGRKEILEATGPAPSCWSTCRLAATRDGMLTAADLTLRSSSGPLARGAADSFRSVLNLYKIANVKLQMYGVTTNVPVTGPYRAPNGPQQHLVTEQAMDEMALTLGIDPIDLRLKNAALTGDRAADGTVLPSVGTREVELALKNHPHYTAPLGGPNRGRGVALAFWGNHSYSSSATITVDSNGGVSLVTGSVDIGGTRPALAMQAAEVLGLSAEDIHPSVGDTASVGFTNVTGGSRVAHDTGAVVIETARQIIERMKERAAIIWETRADDIDFQDSLFISKKDPEDRIGFRDLAKHFMATGGPVSASVSMEPRHMNPSISGSIVDVEVDPETGKAEVLRYTMVMDAGTAVHPSYVEGQMQGGAVQGIGWALSEEYCWSQSGVMSNASFLDYRMPTSLDVPMIDCVIVEVPSPDHPFGLRGAGESPIVSPLAAVANAIMRATGVRMKQLPMKPQVILHALEEARPSQPG